MNVDYKVDDDGFIAVLHDDDGQNYTISENLKGLGATPQSGAKAVLECLSRALYSRKCYRTGIPDIGAPMRRKGTTDEPSTVVWMDSDKRVAGLGDVASAGIPWSELEHA